jgi:PAS domain S-box-containing protein
MLQTFLHADTLAARVARRLVPATLLVMPVLGTLRYLGEVQGLYDTGKGVGLMVLVGMIILGAVSWWSVRLIGRSERARQTAESRLERFFALSPDLFALAGFDGRFFHLNAAWKTTLGYELDDLTARPFLDFVHPDDREATVAALQLLLAGEDVIAFENRYIAHDGSFHWLQWNARAARDDSVIQAVARDVSAARQAADDLRRASAEVQDLYEHAPVGYHSVDAQGVFARINDTELEWLGYQRSELVGQVRFTDLLTAESRASIGPVLDGLATSGEIHDLELDLVRKDGSVMSVVVDSTAIRDAEGGFVRSRTTLVDVTARRLAEAERERARFEADRANRAKSEFLSRMSHELRTPMNSVLGFAQLLEREDGLTADQRDSVHYIASGGRHLLRLIDEVLDISRIEAGRLPLSPEPVAVCDVIGDAVALVRPLAAERRIVVTVENEDCSRHVRADRQRLKQVLLNLLANAVKYNREAGAVRVSCQVTQPGRLQIAVRDTGPGIAPENLDRLFVPFDRLGADQSATEGTGIGLVLSKGLVEAMAGTIGVQSKPGVGTTFWIEFDRIEDPLERVTSSRPEPEGRARATSVGSVLYIEDNLANVKLIERILADRPGVQLLTAMQGRLGIELACRHRPDLVLLDLHLPDLPGQEVLHSLRTTPETEHIPVAIISADATNGQVGRLLSAGATAYLAKPLDVAELLAVVDNAVGPGVVVK